MRWWYLTPSVAYGAIIQSSQRLERIKFNQSIVDFVTGNPPEDQFEYPGLVQSMMRNKIFDPTFKEFFLLRESVKCIQDGVLDELLKHQVVWDHPELPRICANMADRYQIEIAIQMNLRLSLRMLFCHPAFPANVPSIGNLLYSLSYRSYELARWFISLNSSALVSSADCSRLATAPACMCRLDPSCEPSKLLKGPFTDALDVIGGAPLSAEACQILVMEWTLMRTSLTPPDWISAVSKVMNKRSEEAESDYFTQLLMLLLSDIRFGMQDLLEHSDGQTRRALLTVTCYFQLGLCDMAGLRDILPQIATYIIASITE